MKQRIDGMNMTQAWRAAGAFCRSGRAMGWWAPQHRSTSAGYAIFTLWLEKPDALNFRMLDKSYDRLELWQPEHVHTGPIRKAKGESYWQHMHMLTSKNQPIRILAVKHRRDSYGKFLPGQDGNAIPLWIRDYKSSRNPDTGLITLVAEDVANVCIDYAHCQECGYVFYPGNPDKHECTRGAA